MGTERLRKVKIAEVVAIRNSPVPGNGGIRVQVQLPTVRALGVVYLAFAGELSPARQVSRRKWLAPPAVPSSRSLSHGASRATPAIRIEQPA